jgi:hypothetical protein
MQLTKQAQRQAGASASCCRKRMVVFGFPERIRFSDRGSSFRHNALRKEFTPRGRCASLVIDEIERAHGQLDRASRLPDYSIAGTLAQ